MTPQIPLPNFPGGSANGGLLMGALILLVMVAATSRQMPAPATQPVQR